MIILPAVAAGATGFEATVPLLAPVVVTGLATVPAPAVVGGVTGTGLVTVPGPVVAGAPGLSVGAKALPDELPMGAGILEPLATGAGPSANDEPAYPIRKPSNAVNVLNLTFVLVPVLLFTLERFIVIPLKARLALDL